MLFSIQADSIDEFFIQNDSGLMLLLGLLGNPVKGNDVLTCYQTTKF